MWKAIYPGDKVKIGDTIRYRPSSSNLAYKQEIYQVIKTEQHYFEIMIKSHQDITEHPERWIIKYIDIGYHLDIDVWVDPIQTVNDSQDERSTLK